MRGKVALAMGAVAVAAAARPALDAVAARMEARLNPVTAGPWAAPSDRATALHATLRIADLHADVELLQVECAAARHNLMECLKKSGHLELGDRKMALSEIKDEIRKIKAEYESSR